MAGDSLWDKILAMRPSPEQRAENREFVRNMFTRPSPEQRAENREFAARTGIQAGIASAGSLPIWAQIPALMGAKMLESGGEMPTPQPAAQAKVAQVVDVPQALQPAAAPASQLEKILGNLAKETPDGKISLGALRKLGSVFPGTPTATKGMDVRDIAGYKAMQIEDAFYNAALEQAKNARTQQEADQLRTAAEERRKQLYLKIATNEKSDDAAMAEILRGAQGG